DEQRLVLLRRVSFLNQVVHELKTPLAGLKLHVQLAKRGGASPETMEAIDVSVGRINRLFDDIVVINRPDRHADLESVGVADLENWRRSWSAEHGDLVQVEGEFTRP